MRIFVLLFFVFIAPLQLSAVEIKNPKSKQASQKTQHLKKNKELDEQYLVRAQAALAGMATDEIRPSDESLVKIQEVALLIDLAAESGAQGDMLRCSAAFMQAQELAEKITMRDRMALGIRYTEQQSHLVDLARFLLGELKELPPEMTAQEEGHQGAAAHTEQDSQENVVPKVVPVQPVQAKAEQLRSPEKN